jgi:hypothetical protein
MFEAIKTEWFFEGKNTKTKLNWFLYEMALEYHTFIMRNQSLEQYRKNYKEQEVAQFCADFAKQLKKSILEKLSGMVDAVVIDEEYIASHFPKNSAKQNQILVETAFAAWDSLLSICVTCPIRCISEKEQYCELFDTHKDY